jgi:uncharacterized protein (TIGR03083 family)
MSDLLGPYQRTRARVCTLLLDASDDDLALTVPACPEWTVHDLAAHLVGTPAELAAGRFPTSDFGPWLQSIVDARSDDEIPALVDEWNGLDDAIAPILQGAGGLMFGDVAVHEHDLRGALGRADHDALEVDAIMSFALAFYAAPAEEAGIGALVVEHDGHSWRSHDAEAGCTLLVEPWEAIRAVYSRRTADELRALPTNGDIEPYVAIISAHLPLPEHSLGE